MTIRWNALFAPKAGSPLTDYEDSYACSADATRVAIADGAGAAFESGRWARLLTGEFVKSPPGGLSSSEILGWSSRVSEQWRASFAMEELNPFEWERVSYEGSAATFAGLSITEETADESGTWQCVALGDSCVFQVSQDQLVRAVPVTSSADFGTHPPLVYTDPALTGRVVGQLATEEGNWAAGDWFLLLTDAMAEWFLHEFEHGGRPWNILAALDQESFAAFIDEQRRREQIVDDDVTVLILQTSPAPVLVPAGGKGDEEHVLVGAGAPSSAPGPPPGQERPGQERRRPDPGPAQPPRRPYLRRLTEVGILVPLVVALLVGILIGKAIGGGSSTPAPALAPTPSPTPDLKASPAPAISQTAAMETAADGFARAAVTSAGKLSGYEAALDAYATAGLANRLPRLLNLKAAPFTSTGTVTFTAPGPGPRTVYVGTVQKLALKGRRQKQRFLVLVLTMTQADGGWRVSDVSFQPTSSDLLPVPAPRTSPSTTPSGGQGGTAAG